MECTAAATIHSTPSNDSINVSLVNFELIVDDFDLRLNEASFMTQSVLAALNPVIGTFVGFVVGPLVQVIVEETIKDQISDVPLAVSQGVYLQDQRWVGGSKTNADYLQVFSPGQKCSYDPTKNTCSGHIEIQ